MSGEVSMCQMRIILKQDHCAEIILENAAFLQVVDDGIRVSALFEPEKLIQGAAVSGIDFLANEVTLIKTGRQV